MKKVLLAISVLFLSSNLCVAQITLKNDSLFFKQKELFEKLEVLRAWEITRGNPNILIGCIDNGFDFFHPYLNNQLIPGYYADGAYHPLTFTTMSHGMTANKVKKAILDGCDDIEEKGVDIYTGHGRINFGKTIELVKNRRSR